MKMKRLAAFICTVMITFIIIAVTSPQLIQNTKLGLDLKGGFEILYEAQPVEEGGTITKEALRQTARSLEKRADAYGVAEPEVTPEGTNRIRARIAGVADEQTVREMMKKPANLTFRGPDGKIELHGSDFVEGAAQVGFDDLHQPLIQIKVRDKDKLKQVTEKLLHQPLSIYLDEEELSAPVVRSVLTDGNASITGSYTQAEARELAEVINMGALPLKLTEKYTQSVGATLGQQSLEQTVKAGTLASIFILLFMIILYRVPGIVASISLITYAWALLLVMNAIQSTLTLPGIAAFVLGIGMAVDANIITYERIKEEIRSGKSMVSALKAGSKHSFRTIMDANITTILAGAVLYYMGTGAIQGFALTLILSILLSIVTNVIFARFLLQLLLKSNLITKPGYLGVKPSQITSIAEQANTTRQITETNGKFDFVKYRKVAFSLSIAMTVAGIISLMTLGFNFGVDFKAGTSIDITIGKSITKPEADQIVQSTGLVPGTMTIGGTEQDRITIRFDKVLNSDKGEAESIIQAFRKAYGDQVSGEEHTVDPGIAQELGLKAIYAVLLASIGIIIYVAVRFEWRFALASVLALLYSAFMVITLFSLLQLEVNLPFIAAILTIIGYSINDTIVIFDRIRENLRFATLKNVNDLSALVNNSIKQTFVRSMNTGLTVMVASLILYVFGSESIQLFSLAMTLGLIFGVCSSLFIAGQVWLVLKKSALSGKSS
ncbi:protein translocase subunit SecD [Paenibacillus sp. ACRRX]|uniref:protein translocase subunit SecD n=1 Tax=unclassified Paenibacillus TaxID=185978 RepID=UPI001EF40EFE|nr:MULTISPECIES: protein translocase subunit SecD [unclassified Paenibacillus]MCG7407256.1 protein translocase subunit SecD [Paenibacillus sp. ACRRX]MDK8180475.1 protein translocase subunit SecD [Paenibacillus sp. UMB4589-SE434]